MSAPSQALISFVFSSGGGGSPAIVAHTQSPLGTNGGTTTGINTTGANLLIAHIGWYPGHDFDVTFTDSNSNTWTALTALADGGGGTRSRLYYCSAGTVGSSHTFSVSGTTIAASIEILALSGMAATPFDQQSGSSGSSISTIQPGSITPSQAHTVLFTGVTSVSNSAGTTINGGFTISDTAPSSGSNRGTSLAYLILTSAAATNPTWNITSSDSDVTAVMASFKY